MTTRTRLFALPLALALGALGGCFHGGGGDTPAANNNPPPGGNSTSPPGGNSTSSVTSETQIDATAGGFGAPPTDPKNKYTYFNLDSGQVVNLTDAQAAASADWHIAFKRSSVKLNGGVSGPGKVKGAVADDQYSDGFYTNSDDMQPNVSVFLSATKDSEKEDFDAVTDVSALTYQGDRNVPAIKGDGGAESWWAYDPITHMTSANANYWWLVKSAGGDSYTKLHVTNLVRDSDSRDITLELFIQGAGQSTFSTTAVTPTLSLPLAGGAKCYDFDAGAEADCAGAAWDIKAEYDATARLYHLWTNGGVSTTTGGKGRAFGKITQADIGGYADGTHDAGGADISGLYFSDKAGGVFVDKSWYAYGLKGNGDHGLYPNYRVYALDTGAAKYKLQILSYYDAGGASGWITLRHAPVAAKTATVNITLKEWSVAADVSSVPAGLVKFLVKNDGPSDTHEFVVVKTDLAPESLPVDASGKVDENGAGIQIIGEIEDITVGSSTHLKAFDLAPGKYVLICNIYDAGEKEAHYHEGMRMAFTVAGN